MSMSPSNIFNAPLALAATAAFAIASFGAVSTASAQVSDTSTYGSASKQAAGGGERMRGDKRGGERGGRRGGRMAGMLCNSERSAERQAAMMEIPNKLGLSAEQLALFNTVVSTTETARTQLAPACAQIEEMRSEGTRNREQRKQIGETMKQSAEPIREATKAFRESLTDEQRQAMRELMPRRGGKRGNKRGQN